jgi:hypothetical protein
VDEELAELADAAARAARNARQAMALTVIAAVAAAAVMIIDQGIKRAVLAKALEAQNILGEFISRSEVVLHGTTGSGKAGSGPGAGISADPGLVDDAAPAAVLDQAAGAPDGAPDGEPAGVAGGPPGDG